MPIGTVDYVSALPWNDPMNPWPAYSRIMLSAADVSLGAGVPLAYDLSYFYPASFSLETAWIYTCAQTTVDDMYPAVRMDRDSVAGTSLVTVIFDGAGQYYVIKDIDDMQTKGIPAGYVQGNAAWQVENGDDVTTLSIVPDINYITPWEHRRRWALNG